MITAKGNVRKKRWNNKKIISEKNINNIISGIENVIFLISNNIKKQQQPQAKQAKKKS